MGQVEKICNYALARWSNITEEVLLEEVERTTEEMKKEFGHRDQWIQMYELDDMLRHNLGCKSALPYMRHYTSQLLINWQ